MARFSGGLQSAAPEVVRRGDRSVPTVVVLPTYCEAQTIDRVLDSALGSGIRPDVLVVDDSSPDGTGDRVKRWSERTSPGRVRLLTRPEKDGLGAAYRAGFARALHLGYDTVVQMDADGSHPASALPRMRDELAAGADLVIGSRYVQGGSVDETWPWRRRTLSRAGNLYAQAVLHCGVADLTGGFKMWRASLLRALDLTALTARGYAFQFETTFAAARAGAVIHEVPIHFAERAAGDSKMHGGIVREALRDVWATRRRLPAGTDHRPPAPRHASGVRR